MSKRILVVEDQPDNRQIIRDMLAPTDYEITEAEDGQQALEAIAKTATRSDFDGYPIADHGRLHRHKPYQSGSCFTIDSNHRGDVLCAQWGGEEGASGRL